MPCNYGKREKGCGRYFAESLFMCDRKCEGERRIEPEDLGGTHDRVVVARRSGGCGGRRSLVQEMEVSPPAIDSVSLRDDKNDGRGTAPIPRQANTQDRKRTSIGSGSQARLKGNSTDDSKILQNIA